MPLTYVVNDLNNEEIFGKFYVKRFQKTNQKGFRVEQVIKRKGIKLFFKWKCQDNLFISWKIKKGII